MSARPAAAMELLVGFLGDLGPRWGLPADACRVHGYLYLLARPAGIIEIGAALGLSPEATDTALLWLADYQLTERNAAGLWLTATDPWELVLRALQERRRRDLGPALEMLQACETLAAGVPRDPVLLAQIRKLREFAADLDAIDSQAQQISAKTMRRMAAFGGHAVRFVNRTFPRRRPYDG